MIPLPRPVGIASQAEAMVVETERPIDPQEALQQLRRHTPPGIQLMSIRGLAPGERLHPDSVRYRLETDQPPSGELLARMDAVRAMPAACVERVDHGTKKARTVDIRPFLIELTATDQGVEFMLKLEGQASAKPAEVAGLLGFDASRINHRIRRLSVEWQ